MMSARLVHSSATPRAKWREDNPQKQLVDHMVSCGSERLRHRASSAGRSGDAYPVALAVCNELKPLKLLAAGVGERHTPRAAAFSSFPTWTEAYLKTEIEHTVHAQMQASVQPQLDHFSERLAMLLATEQVHSHGGRQDLENGFLRLENRLDSRYSSLEAKVATLAETYWRGQDRERDMDLRMRAFGDGGMAKSGQLEQLECHLKSLAGRVDEIDEAQRSCSRTTRRLEKGATQCAESLAQLEQECLKALASKAPRLPGADSPFAARLDSLEEQLQVISSRQPHIAPALTTPPHAQTSTTAVQELVSLLELRFEARLEAQGSQLRAVSQQALHNTDDLRESLQAECEAAKATMSDHARRADARFEERFGEASKGLQDAQKSIASRLDESNSKIGALQVKATGLEGRLQSTADLVNSRCRPLDAEMREHVADACAKISVQVAERVEEVERRVECLYDECESLVEDTLERRLAELSGSGDARRSTPRLGTRSRPA
jgi:hypothetical protein